MITDSQIRAALINEYDFLCHEDFDPDNDMTVEQFTEFVNTLNREQLIDECSLDGEYTLEEYVSNHTY